VLGVAGVLTGAGVLAGVDVLGGVELLAGVDALGGVGAGVDQSVGPVVRLWAGTLPGPDEAEPEELDPAELDPAELDPAELDPDEPAPGGSTPPGLAAEAPVVFGLPAPADLGPESEPFGLDPDAPTGRPLLRSASLLSVLRAASEARVMLNSLDGSSAASSPGPPPGQTDRHQASDQDSAECAGTGGEQ
jgi:hypothetical protein